MPEKEPCPCSSCEAVYRIIDRPGDSELIMQCERCGQLWYSMIYERMNFEGGKDTFEEYQIPITQDELTRIKKMPYEDLDYRFLAGRRARVFHERGVVEVTSSFALSRCGKKFW